MIRLLADNNADGHLEILVGILMSEPWLAYWNELDLAVVSFEDLGIRRNAGDAELWRACQQEQIVLVTNNRNADDPESLETTIRRENQSDSLPVFTLARSERIRVDRDYAERAALRLLEYLAQLDNVRGAGRLYVP